MRLLACDSNGKLSFTEDIIDEAEIPPYAILSHTWQDGQEVTFDEARDNSLIAKKKSGYDKISFCLQQAKRANLHYVWVDTCCINKTKDLIELQVALNSMFKWYQRSVECYVYLSDVSASDGSSKSAWEHSFRESRWFTRSWTLQELLAPRELIFFSREGIQLGNKRSLVQQINEITGIPVLALRGTPLNKFGIEERMSWVRKRQATRHEDKAYSLLGIFDVTMVSNYGETEEAAMRRLRDEIRKLNSPWLVPFPRPRFFVGRKSQLARVSTHISAEGGQRLAIYGLGGCGKTALALESVYRMKEQYPAHSIFWISAVSRQSFEQGFHDIAALMRASDLLYDDEDDVKESRDIKQRVMARLSNEKFGQWLLVVDNADDTDVLFGEPDGGSDTTRLIDHLPVSNRGSILFTTRTRSAALRLAESNVLPLGELDKPEAAEVLETRLLQEYQYQLQAHETVHEFLGLLSYHALAIVQAVAYINMNDFTLSDYIARYRNSERDAVKLLSEEFEDQGRYRNTNNSVATAWFLSFEQMQKQDNVAAYYMSFMACVANNDIPISMLPKRYTDAEHAKAVSTLKAYAFIAEQHVQKQVLGYAQPPVKAFSVHPLVHLSMRSWLIAHNQWDIWKERVVAHLLEIMPYGDLGKKSVWSYYLPHAQHVLRIPEARRTKGKIWLLEVVGECEKTVWYEYHNHSCREAAIQGEELLGQEHMGLANVGTQAKVMMFEGDYEGAKKLLREVIAIEKKTWGDMRTYTLLVCTAHLAWFLSEYRWYRNAEVLLREQIAEEKKAPGSIPPRLLFVYTAHLGFSLRGQKRDKEGNKLLREALALDQKICGKSHSMLESLGKVGRALDELARFTEQESKLREELTLRTKTHGSEHEETIRTMNKLRTVLYHQHEFVKAEEVQQDILVLCFRFYRDDQREILRQRGHLANILCCQTRYAEAVAMEQDVLSLKDRLLGELDPDTLACVINLAEYLETLEQYEDALALYKRASEGYRATLGPDHDTTGRWTYVYEGLKEAVDSGVAKNKDLAKTGASSVSSVSESKDSNVTGLAVRPKEWWRPRMKKWKAGRETLQRWLSECDTGKHSR